MKQGWKLLIANIVIEMKANSKQMEQIRDEKGRIVGGPPPAGFNKHPENRHNGAWKKEDTPRFKLEQMMKLSENELGELLVRPDVPLFEQKLAKAILEGQWREIKEMIQEVYGKPQESVDVTSKGEQIGAVISFENRPSED